MKNIVIFGSGGHAKVVADIIERERKFKIVGLIDLPNHTGFWGYQNVGCCDDLNVLIEKYGIYGGVVAIGDNWTRATIVEKIIFLKKDFVFINAIHPFTQIGKNVKIGGGTVIMAGVVINSDTFIGEHCIINTNSSIDHDNAIANFCSVAPNVGTGGNVKIGAYSAISLGANIIHNVSVGDHTVVGAGSLVITDIDSGVMAYGVPAKRIKNRRADAGYL